MSNLTAEKIAALVMQNAGKGLKEAAKFLAERVREVLDTPVPKPYTPATVGAPPRKRTGKLQASVIVNPKTVRTVSVNVPVKSDKGFYYGIYHEKKQPGRPMSGRHPFVKPTADKYRRELAQILAKWIRVTVS